MKLAPLTYPFQVCKCVSVRLLSVSPPDCRVSTKNRHEPSALWMMSVPDPVPDVSLKYAIVPRPNTRASCVRTEAQLGSQIRLNIEFGGPHGEKLALLNRIIGIFDAATGLLRGLGFTYDDGTKLFYGSHVGGKESNVWKPHHEISFAIDGKRCERLDEIRVHTCRHTFNGSAYIRGLQVC